MVSKSRENERQLNGDILVLPAPEFKVLEALGVKGVGRCDVIYCEVS